MAIPSPRRPLVGSVVLSLQCVCLALLFLAGSPALADHAGPLVDRKSVTGTGNLFCTEGSGGNPGLGYEFGYKYDAEPPIGTTHVTLNSEPSGGPPLNFSFTWDGTHFSFQSERPVQAVIIKPGTVPGDVYAYSFPPANPQGLWDPNDSYPGPTNHDNGLTKSVSQAISHVDFCLNATPQIRVDKVLVPADDEGRFDLLINGEVAASAVGDGGTTGFVPGLIGMNQVGEEAVAPAELDEYVVSIGGDCDANGQVELAAFGSATCVITNTRKGSVQLIKLTDGELTETTWTFRLSGPDGDTTQSTGTGDDAGLIDFGDRLVPGDYRLCETNLPAGWSSVWEFDGELVETILVGDETCYDFEVDAGGQHQFLIDNIPPPGGEARTIGYWGNWNHCTPGNQAQTAANNGGAAEGFYLVEDVIPQSLGGLVIDNCQDAVNILRKRDLGGSVSASDAAYSMAAQLLAVRFNLAAGAGACAEVLDAANSANGILSTLGFNGWGEYLTSQNRPRRNMRNQALELADTLDRYNNNILCQ